MTPYNEYGMEDFLNDNLFLEWINSPKAESSTFWEDFIASNPEKAETIEKAKQLINAIQLAETEKDSQNNSSQLVDEVWKKLAVVEGNTNYLLRTESTLNRFWWVAAASVVILLIGGGGFWMNSSQNKITNESLIAEYNGTLIEKVNLTDKIQKIILPDNTVISLEKNSKVSYNEDFKGDLREVFLTGEAFFEVTRNVNKPFVVYTNEVTTKVLGTSFRIKAYQKEATIMVAVKTGKVSVSVNENRSSGSASNIILKPNQQMVYERLDNKIKKELVEKPNMLVPIDKPEYFYFEDALLSDVLKRIEITYGIEIVYDEELLSKCTITADLKEESLYDKLDLVCRTLGLRYEIIDGQVIMSGDGCKNVK